MNEDDFPDCDLDMGDYEFDTLEDLLDDLLDSPTDFDEYIMNEDDSDE